MSARGSYRRFSLQFGNVCGVAPPCCDPVGDMGWMEEYLELKTQSLGKYTGSIDMTIINFDLKNNIMLGNVQYCGFAFPLLLSYNKNNLNSWITGTRAKLIRKGAVWKCITLRVLKTDNKGTHIGTCCLKYVTKFRHSNIRTSDGFGPKEEQQVKGHNCLGCLHCKILPGFSNIFMSYFTMNYSTSLL